jgi:peroxiredoxin
MMILFDIIYLSGILRVKISRINLFRLVLFSSSHKKEEKDKMLARAVATPLRYAFFRSFSSIPLDDPKLVVKKVDGSELTGEQLFKGKKVVLFGVPGAFTPVCSLKHVPSFIEKAEDLKNDGVDTIACVSVNDNHVMRAWGEQIKTGDKVVLLADPDGSFVKSLGLDINLPSLGGIRSKRFSMLVDNGEVVLRNVEKSAGEFELTGPEPILDKLNEKK